MYRGIEQELHYRYRDKKVLGEWFALADEDVERIKSLNRLGRTPQEQAERDESDRQWANREKTEEEIQVERELNSFMGGLLRSMPLDPPIKNVTPPRKPSRHFPPWVEKLAEERRLRKESQSLQ